MRQSLLRAVGWIPFKRTAPADSFFADEGRLGWKIKRSRIDIMVGPRQEINR